MKLLLDRIADSHGITRITAFADDRSVPEEFDGPPEELDDLLGPWDAWFEPGAGRVATQALADLIREKPQVSEKLEDAAEVVFELQELIRVLGIAEKQGARFRLEMS